MKCKSFGLTTAQC